MGADWYEPVVFFGVTIPLEHVKALYYAMEKGFLKDTPYDTLYLYESWKHSRCEGEDVEDFLDRCDGFLGIVGVKEYSLEELAEYRDKFCSFLLENADVLKEYDIGFPELMAGFTHDNIDDYLEFLPGEVKEENTEPEKN